MAGITSSPSSPTQFDTEEDDDESLDGFDCQPIVRSSHYDTYTSPAPERTRMPSAIRNLGIRLNSRRKATLHAAIQGFATAYIDQDTSGTYDPKKSRATPEDSPAPKPKKRRAPRVLDGDGDRPPPRAPKGYKLSKIVVLKLRTAEGRNHLRSLMPDSRSSTVSDELSNSETDPDDSGHRSLEKRKTRRQRAKRAFSTRDDGLTLDQLTNGHPQLRGCKGCFEAGDDHCTLIEDAFQYPCEACQDTGIDCELIIPPELKKACERCKNKRIQCSYVRDGGKGVCSCDACEEAGELCCAGPRQVASYARRSDDSRSHPGSSRALHASAPLPSAPTRVFVSCNQCRSNSLRCSLKRGQPGPCSNCRKAGDNCKFVFKPVLNLADHRNARAPSTPSGIPREQRLGNPHTPTKNSQVILTEAAQRASRSSKGKQHFELKNTNSQAKLIGWTTGVQHIYINTSFCHPIKFYYDPDPMKKYPCSWCASPVFGLWGHGLKENVEIIPWGGAIGNEEIEKGHAADGHQNSRMCMLCTLDRISIMMCAKHETMKIRGLERKLLDPRVIEENLERMLEGDEQGAELVNQVKWCSICVAPAEFECCTATLYTPDGCGLLLCLTCEDLMGRMMKGLTTKCQVNIMDQLIKLWKSEEWTRGGDGEIRADVEFLESKGELKARLDQGMGMSSYMDPKFRSPRTIEKKRQGKLNDGMSAGGDGKKELQVGSPKKWKGKGKDMTYFESRCRVSDNKEEDVGSITSTSTARTKTKTSARSKIPSDAEIIELSDSD